MPLNPIPFKDFTTIVQHELNKERKNTIPRYTKTQLEAAIAIQERNLIRHEEDHNRSAESSFQAIQALQGYSRCFETLQNCIAEKNRRIIANSALQPTTKHNVRPSSSPRPRH